MTKITSTKALHELLSNHFRLLEAQGKTRKRFTAELSTSGYSGIIYTIADIIKVAILALEAQETSHSARIPDPNLNISGVLELILNLLPYEEAELLDILHREYLDGSFEEVAPESEEIQGGYSTIRVIG